MRMKVLTGALLLVGTLAFASAAAAQSTNDNTNSTNSNSNASLNSTQQAQSSNEGVNAVVNQYGQKNTHAVVDSQVPLSLGGYGSFSQSNCSNALGVGASTKIFSFVASAPKPEINCQHIVRADSFGREANLAMAHRKPMQAEINRAMSVWQSCTTDEETTAACIRMALIRYVDPEHPDLKQTMPWPKFEDVGIVMPARGQAAGTQTPDSIKAPAQDPQARHSGEASIQRPYNPSQQVADAGQTAINALPWVQKYQAVNTNR
jgi:hypothetical protein